MTNIEYLSITFRHPNNDSNEDIDFQYKLNMNEIKKDKGTVINVTSFQRGNNIVVTILYRKNN